MSTLPPESPPPASGAAGGLPWEEREKRGFFQSLSDTMGLFVSRPAEAWARTRESGDFLSPFLFGTLVAWFSFVIHRLVGRIFTLPMLPGSFGRRLGAMEGYTAVGFFLHVILSPIFIAIALFVAAAILHVCCLIVGALAASRSGFEGTFRVVAYSEIASLAGIIPVVGGVIAIIWWIVLAVMGVQRLHRTSQGKALAAVFIPIILCCGGIFLLGILAGAAFLMRGAR